MGENRLMADLYEENQRLKGRIKELEEKHFSECGQIAHYDDELKAVEEIARRTAEWGKTSPVDFLDLLDENAKMKELLKAAVDDVRYCMRSYDPCEVCALLEENGECAAADDDDCGEKYKWRYEAEALALIGEDGDTNE